LLCAGPEQVGTRLIADTDSEAGRGEIMSKRGPDPRDVQVARRVRALRLERGMSQTDLGNRLGVTFQQVQKYEKGTNRIGAGRLQRIAEVFNVPISVFFSGSESADVPSSKLFELIDTAASLRLLRAYSRIRDPQIQQALTRLTEKIAGEN